jgi:hypothetical protein
MVLPAGGPRQLVHDRVADQPDHPAFASASCAWTRPQVRQNRGAATRLHARDTYVLTMVTSGAAASLPQINQVKQIT